MEKTKSFEELPDWQKAHEFVLSIYKSTDNFPKSEIFGLTSQFRRAAVSIADNIAEWYKKKDCRNKINFLNIAHSSLEECRYYLILSRDLKYYYNETNIPLANEVSKLLTAYAKAIQQNKNN